MDLFRGGDQPRLAHLRARRERCVVELDWQLRNAVLTRWRVLRSGRCFATIPRSLPGNGQTVIMEGTETRMRDEQVQDAVPYFYTVFMQDARGEWQCQAKTKVKECRRLRRDSGSGSAFESDLAGDSRQRSRNAAEVIVQRNLPGPRG